jgi:hypothetical protein
VLEIIASIDNDGQVFGRKNLSESVRELCATDSSGKSNDFQFN